MIHESFATDEDNYWKINPGRFIASTNIKLYYGIDVAWICNFSDHLILEKYYISKLNTFVVVNFT